MSGKIFWKTDLVRVKFVCCTCGIADEVPTVLVIFSCATQMLFHMCCSQMTEAFQIIIFAFTRFLADISNSKSDRKFEFYNSCLRIVLVFIDLDGD